jgi:MFS family permease
MNLPFKKMDIPLKVALGNIIMIVNLVVWYDYTSAILREAVDKTLSAYVEKLVLDVMLFSAVVASVLLGAFLVNKLSSRKRFLLAWDLMGVFSSLALVMLETATIVNVSFLLILVGISFGLGLPVYMANFANITKIDNRARFGSIVILVMFLGIFAFEFVMPKNLFLGALALAAWRFSGLVGILPLESFLEDKKQQKSPPMVSVLTDRSVLLYLIPWTIFSLINYLGWPINSRIHGEDFVYFSALINSVIAGIFAPIAGFLADSTGRKRTLVSGFIIFGIGYAVLGINPFNIYAWYFYSLVDGVAWGIIYVIFWFTIWGDLANGKSSEKYYAVGIIPYSLSGFLRVTLGPYIANTVSEYAIFSFAAFFLFLAVVPLMYAPETLPEKTLRERELRSYIEKAKRVREKFTKG